MSRLPLNPHKRFAGRLYFVVAFVVAVLVIDGLCDMLCLIDPAAGVCHW